MEFKKRETKRDAVGGVFNEDVIPFDDSYVMNNSINHRVKQLDIFHDGHNLIFGNIKHKYKCRILVHL